MALELKTPDAFTDKITAKRVFLAGFPGEPTAVIEAFLRRPIRGAEARLTGVVIPGVNRQPIAAIVPEGRVESAFVTTALRAAFEARRVDFRPMHYSALYQSFQTRRDIDLAVMRTSAPRRGCVSLGLAHDFASALLAAGTPMAAMIDPETPFVADGVTVPLERFVALIDGPSPAIVLPPDPPRAELEAIARHVAALVRDGDAIQTGIGSAPNAVLRVLADHRRLTLYGGMVSDAGLDLLDRGAAMAVTTGVAVCGDEWRRRLASETRVHFRGVDQTHGAMALAAVPRLVAINSAVEIDLYGQVNGELLAGQQISGHGGVADFVRGARLSAGGRSIICLGASGNRGQVSRIVPALETGTPVAVTRGDIDHVVTEFGAADLRDTDIDTRAARLIAIAAPAFRDALAVAWDARRRRL